MSSQVHCIIRLSDSGSAEKPRYLHWKNTLLDRDLGHTIVVDMPMDNALGVQAQVQNLDFKGLLGWGMSCRSAAHTAQQPRQFFYDYFDVKIVSLLDLALLVKYIKTIVQGEGIYVGSLRVCAC